MIAHRTQRPRKYPKREPVRYAVVGLGWIAVDAVLPAFANASRNSQLAALVSGDEDKLKELGEQYNVEHLYTYDQYDECLHSGEIDAVYIALPNNLHHEYTIRAAEAGIHVLCEKPLAINEEECVEMIDAAEANHVKLMPAYRLHFEEANLAAIAAATDGTIGDVRIFNSTFTQLVNDPDDIRLQKDLGGGALYDIGIYCINAARYIFQEEPLEVSAVIEHTPGERRFAEVDETTSVVMRFPRGRIASFTCSQNTASHSAYEVIGTKGVLRVSPAYEFNLPLKHTLEVDGRTKQRTFSKRDQFAPELLHFSECIRSDTMPQPSGDEGLADIHIIRSLFDAAESGQAVELDAHTLSARR